MMPRGTQRRTIPATVAVLCLASCGNSGGRMLFATAPGCRPDEGKNLAYRPYELARQY